MRIPGQLSAKINSLTAGSGKTSLGAGSGSIEASLIETGAFNRAGWMIAKIITASNIANGKNVFLVGRSDQVDMSAAASMLRNIENLQQGFKNSKCVTPPPPPAAVAPDLAGKSAGVEVPLKDAIATFATDTSISSATVNADDRMLLDAVLVNAHADKEPLTWKTEPGAPDAAAATARPNYLIASEATKPAAGGPIADAYHDLSVTADGRRGCSDDQSKKLVAAFDTFATKVTAVGDKSSPSPLVVAIEQQAFARGDPYVLRLAVEQTGGTTITRSGIRYELGWPDAALVSAGLVVSFRLIKPNSGQTVLVGFVRCGSKPKNIKHITGSLADVNDAADVACSYLLGPTTDQPTGP